MPIQIPEPKHNKDFVDHDLRYYQRKKAGDPSSYSQIMMRREYEIVTTGVQHASLGKNVPDRDEKGKYNFDYYRSLLSLDRKHKVIDFGCGTLRIGQFFIYYLDRSHYFGLDVERNFLDLGRSMLPQATINEKAPVLCEITTESLHAAEAFGADFVFSNSVAYHIHQDDLEDYFGNLARLASKPGCVLVFDAKVSDEPLRYNTGGWAWPLNLYQELLRPLGFVRLHNSKPYKKLQNCVIAQLEFRASGK